MSPPTPSAANLRLCHLRLVGGGCGSLPDQREVRTAKSKVAGGLPLGLRGLESPPFPSRRLQGHFAGGGNKAKEGPNYLSVITCVGFKIRELQQGKQEYKTLLRNQKENLKYVKGAIFKKLKYS